MNESWENRLVGLAAGAGVFTFIVWKGGDRGMLFLSGLIVSMACLAAAVWLPIRRRRGRTEARAGARTSRPGGGSSAEGSALSAKTGPGTSYDPTADDGRRTESPDRQVGRAETGPPLAHGKLRLLVYVFQHEVLPEAAFENHPELISALESGVSPTPLLHFWVKAEVRLARATGTSLSGALESESVGQEELYDATTLHSYNRCGFTAHVVTMPKPECCSEAYFAAIVHKDDESHRHGQESPSTRYFVLEKSLTPLPMLCEWLRDGSHINLGQGPLPDQAAFVEAVFARVSCDAASTTRGP